TLMATLLVFHRYLHAKWVMWKYLSVPGSWRGRQTGFQGILWLGEHTEPHLLLLIPRDCEFHRNPPAAHPTQLWDAPRCKGCPVPCQGDPTQQELSPPCLHPLQEVPQDLLDLAVPRGPGCHPALSAAPSLADPQLRGGSQEAHPEILDK
uniref:Uncharacterized protein n=1 Tax=Taeniopygia guttata TaxID=59729 RepID=A0A674GLZ3_TAEGU